jgi:hypothetical protein
VGSFKLKAKSGVDEGVGVGVGVGVAVAVGVAVGVGGSTHSMLPFLRIGCTGVSK